MIFEIENEKNIDNMVYSIGGGGQGGGKDEGGRGVVKRYKWFKRYTLWFTRTYLSPEVVYNNKKYEDYRASCFDPSQGGGQSAPGDEAINDNYPITDM